MSYLFRTPLCLFVFVHVNFSSSRVLNPTPVHSASTRPCISPLVSALLGSTSKLLRLPRNSYTSLGMYHTQKLCLSNALLLLFAHEPETLQSGPCVFRLTFPTPHGLAPKRDSVSVC